MLRRFEREALAPRQARQWRRTLSYVGDILAEPESARSPLVLGAAGRMLAASAIAAFTVEPETVAADESPTRATVRRAIDFLEANPDLDLGIVDIARAAHVSVRTLQVAFRRHLDTTPMTYLRGVRLDRIRAELSAADPVGGSTVTQIAARWGIADLGRLSGHYRRMYGESPSETLRR